MLNQERTIQNIEEFDKSKLKHAETEVKNPLPDKEGEIGFGLGVIGGICTQLRI